MRIKWTEDILIKILKVNEIEVMGAPAIYHIPNRRKSGCSGVLNTRESASVNGLDRRINYDKYLKASADNIMPSKHFKF